MSSEVIPCPSCGHAVRVPESLFGEAVRCPKCKSYFMAPTRDASGLMGTAELLSEPPPLVEQPRSAIGPRPSMDRSPLLIPGLFLLLVGVAGTLVNGYQLVALHNDPAGFRKNFMETQKKVAQMMGQPFDEKQAEKMADNVDTALYVVFGVSVMPLLGALAMLSYRFWPLALAGSIFALFDLGNCCCLIGFPVGIYCLIKLFDPDTRLLFKRD